jgi:hypothetical protein
MKQIYILFVGLMIVMQSCEPSTHQQESVIVDSTSAKVTVDTMPQKPIQEEIVHVDSAKNYYHEPTKEESKRQKEVYEEIFGPRFYKIGAKTSVVIKVEGQPTSISVTGPFKTFYYGRNSLTFYNGRLQEYNNADGSLKVRIDE